MIKDSPYIKENNGLIEINYGRRFPINKNLPAYGIVLFIVVMMLFPSDSGVYVVMIPFCLIILLVMLTATTGVKINSLKAEYQYYFSVFGVSVGSWKRWFGFSCLVLKSSAKKVDRSLTRDSFGPETVTERFKTTEIYMMDVTHRKKILCGSFDTYNSAREFANEMNKIMNYPIQKFSPRKVERKSR